MPQPSCAQHWLVLTGRDDARHTAELCLNVSVPRAGGGATQQEWALDVAAPRSRNLTRYTYPDPSPEMTSGMGFLLYEAAIRHRRRPRHPSVGIRQARAAAAALFARKRRGRG